MRPASWLALVLGALWCLWALLEPFSWTRAFRGDAAGPAIAAVFALAVLGIDRLARGRRTPTGFAQLLEFAGAHPWISLAVIGLAVLANRSPADANAWLWLPGIALVALASVRRSRTSAAGAPLWRCVLLPVSAASFALGAVLLASFTDVPDPAGLGPLTFPAVFAPLAIVGVLEARELGRASAAPSGVATSTGRRPRRDAITRTMVHSAVIWISFLMFFPALLLAGNLDEVRYAQLPVSLGLTAGAGWLARRMARSTGILDEASATVTVAGRIALPTRLWQLFLMMQVGMRPLGRWLDGAWWEMALIPVATLALALVVGTLARACARVDPSAANAPGTGPIASALLPLLAPLVAFALVQALPTPGAWLESVAPRGQVAALFEAVRVPLVGAALLAAAELDGLLFGRTSRAARWIGAGWLLGAALLGSTVADLDVPAFLAPIASPNTIAELEGGGLPARTLLGAGAGVVLAGTLHAWLRLRRLGRGEGVGLAPLVLGLATAIALGAWLVPTHGPPAAAWAAAAGAAAGALAELASPRRARDGQGTVQVVRAGDGEFR